MDDDTAKDIRLFPMVIDTKESIDMINAMEKGHMSGVMGAATKANLKKTNATDEENLHGRMAKSLKASSTKASECKNKQCLVQAFLIQ